jgi:hypothetical protein
VSTLSPTLEAHVTRVVATVRGVGVWEARKTATGGIQGRTRQPVSKGPAATPPRVHVLCVYCGRPGGTVCSEHDDLPVLDSQRAPELYA